MVPSKSVSISTLKADNALWFLLVLHGAVGGGDNLPSGDLNARLLCLFHKEKDILYKVHPITLLIIVFQEHRF